MDVNQDRRLTGNQALLRRLLLANYEGLTEQMRPRIPVQLRTTIDVEDILQVAFLHVFRDFSTFQGAGSSAFRGWARTIADARLAEAIRSATRQDRGAGRNRLENSSASTSPSFLNLLDVRLDSNSFSEPWFVFHRPVSPLLMPFTVR